MTSKRLTKYSYDHNNYSLSYTEENVRRYCEKVNDVYSVECAQCGYTFSDKYGLNRIVPSVTNHVHIYLDQNKFKCRHEYCYICFQRQSNDTEQNKIL